MRFDHVIIGMLIFGAIITGGIMMMKGYNYAYDDVNMSSEVFSDVEDSVDEITEVVDDLAVDTQDKTFESDITKDQLGAGSISSMTRGAYSAVRLVPRTFGLFQSILTSIGKALKLNCGGGSSGSGVCFFINYAFAAFILTIIFAAAYMIFRFTPR